MSRAIVQGHFQSFKVILKTSSYQKLQFSEIPSIFNLTFYTPWQLNEKHL